MNEPDYLEEFLEDMRENFELDGIYLYEDFIDVNFEFI